MKLYRHGDLLIRQVSEVPQAHWQKVKQSVLAEGEVTGHRHLLAPGALTIQLEQATENGEVKYVRLNGLGTITHEEHAPIMLPMGTYEVVRQVEYDPVENNRRVTD